MRTGGVSGGSGASNAIAVPGLGISGTMGASPAARTAIRSTLAARPSAGPGMTGPDTTDDPRRYDPMLRIWLPAAVAVAATACSVESEIPKGVSPVSASPVAASAESEDGAPASESPGLAIGQKAPDFSLKDQNGETQTLSEFLVQGQAVALVFYRSADW